jgi:hypothetical protein
MDCSTNNIADFHPVKLNFLVYQLHPRVCWPIWMVRVYNAREIRTTAWHQLHPDAKPG